MAEKTLTHHLFDNQGQLTLAGSSNAYTVTTDTAVTAYYQGLRICAKANHTNSGASTLNINGIGATAIRKGATTALTGGEILEDKYHDFIYDADNSVFQVMEIAPVTSYVPGGTDVVVADGGTGVSAFTEYAPIFGGTTTTGPLQSGAVGTSSQVLTSNGAGAIATFQSLPPSAMPRGHLFGLLISNNGTDALNDIDVATGEARSDDNTGDLVLASGITKRLDDVWAVGTDQGGLDTGTEAISTWYYVWLIKRSDTSVVDVLLSASATAPTMPADYDLKRRIGAIRNNASSNILPFTQVAADSDVFLFTTPVADVAITNLGTSSQSLTLTVPPSMIALFRAATESDVAGEVLIRPLTETDTGPDNTTGLASIDSTDANAGHFEIAVDASSQIGARASGANTDFNISTRGWIDRRGRWN